MQPRQVESRALGRTTSSDATSSRRNSKIKGFLGKFRRSSRLGQTGSGALPTLGSMAAVSAPVAAVEANREFATATPEPAVATPPIQASEEAAHPSTVLQAIFGNAPSGGVEPEDAAHLASTNGSSGADHALDRDVYTPTERATTERAISVRSEGLYSEPGHHATGRLASRSESPDISSISSEDDDTEVVHASRGRSRRSEVSDDEFEEARDRFDDTGSKTSIARSSREETTHSKFQEELSM